MAEISASLRGCYAQPRTRVTSIDVVRGLVMAVMVLDHVRMYLNPCVDPTDLRMTTPCLFFTRWLTHYCAPSFLLLAGMSAFLGGRNRPKSEQARHLLTRGLFLIVLEQTWVSMSLSFTYPQAVLATALWAIGWSMLTLAAIIRLPRACIGGIGLALIAGHNLFDHLHAEGQFFSALWSLLHVRGFRTIAGVPIQLQYPLIPWVGVMMCGYALGPVFLQPSHSRQRILLRLGGTTLAGFLMLRYLNLYGDPEAWHPQVNAITTAMAFLNCQKYPPSLLFLLMTLGPVLLALAAFEHVQGRFTQPLRLFGQVPLFFYLLQWPLAHGFAVILGRIERYLVPLVSRDSPVGILEAHENHLDKIYIVWVICVALLYWPCLWYARWSRRFRGSAIVA